MKSAALLLSVAMAIASLAPLCTVARPPLPPCCKAHGCVMTNQGRSAFSFATCDRSGPDAAVGKQPPIVVARSVALAHQIVIEPLVSPAFRAVLPLHSSAIDHPPRPRLA